MAKISRIFLTLLGVAYLINFWVLHDQVLPLIGKEGLLPLAPDIPFLKERLGNSFLWQFPTLFFWNASDPFLYAGTWLGLILSVLLIFKIKTKWVLVSLWILFLSYATAGRTFYSFQWDILMLESTLLALFLPSKKEIDPHPVTVWLFRLLAFKLLFESGIAKVWAGVQGGWLNGSAMQYYYDTAPIPTWLGWWAHQTPLWFHQIETYMTLVVEIGVPLLFFFGRRCRSAAFLILVALQIAIALTANYSIFNFMTLAALLFLIEDKDLKWIGMRTDPAVVPQRQRLNWFPKTIALFILLFSLLNFTYFLNPTLATSIDKFNLQRYVSTFRTINNYHLFASITPTRLVVEIEGTDDGIQWKSYHFPYYPGELSKRPPFIAPYHPRLDFRLWFLTLSQQGPDWNYFTRLLGKIFHHPEQVDTYFSKNPFPNKSPAAIRFIIYQYNMTSPEEKKETGSYWYRREHARSQVFYPNNFKR